ncbi:porin [Sphingoaurantiacus capsulatus]|uniref:Porin n=1 Tax=Sphingoaurantiacus capsulatus TaxID=1771310 RepID=A0ABV7X6Z9_9SPHN
MAKRWQYLAGAALVAMASPVVAQDAATTARIEAMQAQIDALQKQLEELKTLTAAQASASPATPPVATAAAPPAPAPKPATPPVQVAWKGAPEFTAEGGWRFKPRGRMQFDAASVGNPNGNIPTANLGFNSRSRRILFGFEGDVPGGIKWRAEFDFAQGGVGYEDVMFQYAPKGSPVSAQFGYFYPFQGLETMSSSGATTFIERAQMTDAFVHSRRIGAAVGYVQGDLRFNAGLFNDSINANFDNDDWMFGSRLVWSPEALGGRIHLGATYQHREFQSNALNFQYRARPFVQTTDVRFTDTGLVAARGDDIYGIEAAGIFGPLHVASEAQWVKTDTIANPATLTGIESVAGGTAFAGNADFFSWYAEAGWWLTGETRGYRDGSWQRTSVKKGFDKGGWGAVGVNLRYDYLDLRDRVATGTPATSFAAPNFVNGGTQTGYLASLIWQPIDYVRFMAQYTRAEIEGGPRAAVVVPGSTAPIPDRDYGVDIFAVRAQFEF